MIGGKIFLPVFTVQSVFRSVTFLHFVCDFGWVTCAVKPEVQEQRIYIRWGGKACCFVHRKKAQGAEINNVVNGGTDRDRDRE